MKKCIMILSGVLLAYSGAVYGWADKIINMTGQDITVARTIGVNSLQTLVVKAGDSPVWARCLRGTCGYCVTNMAVYSEALDSWRDLYWPADDTKPVRGDQCQNWIYWITMRPDGTAQIYSMRGQIGGVNPGYQAPPQ